MAIIIIQLIPLVPVELFLEISVHSLIGIPNNAEHSFLLSRVSTTEFCQFFLPFSNNKTNKMHHFLKFILGMKLCMFQTFPLSIIRSFSLYTQQWYMLYMFADSCKQLSANMYNIYHCCVYSENLLMMDRRNV